MSRPSTPPTVYHLISRFVAGEFFVRTDVERTTYLGLLGDALRQSDWRCIAYAVMSSHIHLGMVAGRSHRSSWLRAAHSPFGEWINRRLERFGSVFAKGLVAYAVAPDDVAKVIAYIHNNPVRAGVASTASDSEWTSHRAYVGKDEGPAWLHVQHGFELMNIVDRGAFDDWVRSEAARPRTPRRPRGRPKRV